MRSVEQAVTSGSLARVLAGATDTDGRAGVPTDPPAGAAAVSRCAGVPGRQVAGDTAGREQPDGASGQRCGMGGDAVELDP